MSGALFIRSGLRVRTALHRDRSCIARLHSPAVDTNTVPHRSRQRLQAVPSIVTISAFVARSGVNHSARYLSTEPVATSPPSSSPVSAVMPAAEYHRLADRALDELLAALDDVEAALPDADITSSYGVLSINLGSRLGHWVINKQAPNQEIWWSSPRSGPRRFRYAPVAGGGGGEGADQWRDVRQLASSASSNSSSVSSSGGSGSDSKSGTGGSSLLAELRREMANVLKQK